MYVPVDMTKRSLGIFDNENYMKMDPVKHGEVKRVQWKIRVNRRCQAG